MKISTKGRYGLRIMLELALNYKNGVIPSREIASRQDISLKYAESIISLLSGGGFISTQRGAAGGHSLKESPENYTVGMILRVLEGSLAPVECVDKQDCSKQGVCTTQKVWRKIKQSVDNVVDNITLEDLRKDAQSQSCGGEYQI